MSSGRWRGVLARPRPGDFAAGGSLAGQAAVVTAGVFVQGLSRFAYSLLIGSVLGQEALGRVGPAIALITFLATLWPTSASNAASKYIAAARGHEDREEARSVTRYLNLTMVRAGAVLMVIAVLWSVVGLDFGWPQALVVGALAIGYSGYSYVRGVLFGSGRSASAAVWDVITSFLTLALLVLTVLGRVEWALLIPLSCGYLVYTAANWPALGQPRPAELEPGGRREIARFVRWGALSSAAAAGTLQLSQMLAPLWSPDATVGLYTAAASLATPAAMLVGSLYLVLFPSVAHAHGAGQRGQVLAQVDVASRALVVTLTGLLGVVAICAEPLLGLYSLFGGHDYSSAAYLLRILVIGVLLANLGAPCVAFLVGTTSNGIRLMAGFNIAALAVSALAIVAISPAGGIIGSALSYLLGGAVVGLGPVVVFWRRTRPRWAALALRCAVGLITIGALSWWLDTAETGWWSLLIAAVFLVAWLALSWSDVRAVLASSPALQRLAGRGRR